MKSLVDRALELGYSGCGIIDLEEMAGYDQKLEERMTRFPETRSFYGALNFTLDDLKRLYPWARSVLVTVREYGRYRAPAHLRGLIGKYYLTDNRHDPLSPDRHASEALEGYLAQREFRSEGQVREKGLLGYRWAAYKAGLGVMRRNNVFYTPKGSWVYLEAWLLAREWEHKSEVSVPPCPDDCRRCLEACPTRALAEPYMLNRSTCVSALTTRKGRDLPHNPHSARMGVWLYGCDICQDVCPFNRNAWTDELEYPRLAELAETISIEKVLAMDYRYLKEVMAEKFWYLLGDDVWKWKVNALNAMRNDWRPSYKPLVEKAVHDPSPQVAEMARWVLENPQSETR